MASNIQSLSELESVLCNNEKTDKGIAHFFIAFKIPRLIKVYEFVKTKGIKISSLIYMLIMFRLRNRSINSMQNEYERIDDNTYYRLMNNPKMNWRKLLMSFAKQFISVVKTKGENLKSIKCFIIDDTDIEKTGKTIENIGKIFNHVTRRYILGFKMLTLCYWDGKSIIATDFSLHREKSKSGNFGMSKKELKKQFAKKRDKHTPSYQRVAELDKKKTEVAISMIKRAIKNGMEASYVLMDSWFMNDLIIKSVRAIKKGAVHVLGMCKLDKRKYSIDGKELNSAQLITRKSRKHSRYSRKHKSHYFSLVAEYKGVKVKSFYIKYGKAKHWTLLQTTDLSLSFVQAIELYQIRWTIEVFFKECKQYLGLGSSQNTDFDGQIADATIALVTHTILTLQKRFMAYETMGELFRETQQYLIELTLWERILKIFLKMLEKLVELFNIDIEDIFQQIIQNDEVAKQILFLLKNLNEDNCNKLIKNAA